MFHTLHQISWRVKLITNSRHSRLASRGTCVSFQQPFLTFSPMNPEDNSCYYRGQSDTHGVENISIYNRGRTSGVILWIFFRKENMSLAREDHLLPPTGLTNDGIEWRMQGVHLEIAVLPDPLGFPFCVLGYSLLTLVLKY